MNRRECRQTTPPETSDSILAARLRLSEYALDHSLDDLLGKALDEAEHLTGSQIGFFHFVDENQKTLTLQNWSANTLKTFCTAAGKGLHYGIDKAGVWVDCVHQRRTVVHNDYDALPHRKGMPPGHPRVLRELVTPVIRGDSVCAILGVGNKPTVYVDSDVDAIELLANLAWDIVQHKRAEEALRQSEEKYRTLINQAWEMLFLHDLDGRLMEVNQAAAKITGYSREELLQMTVYDIDPDADQRQDKREIWDNLSEASPVTFEVRHRRKDGSFYWAEVRTGKVVLHGSLCILALANDITERKQAQQRYQMLFEQMLDGFALHEIICDERGVPCNYRFLAVNPAFERLTGLQAGALVGHTVLDVLPETEPRWISLYGRVAQTGEPVHFHDYSGALGRYYEVTAFCPAPGQFACVFSDVTDRKQAEQVQKRLLNELRVKNEELESIVCIASHDLRSPLVNIRGFAGELEKSFDEIGGLLESPVPDAALCRRLKGILQGEAAEALNFIKRSSQKMDLLLNGLLRLSRIGTTQIHPISINMDQMVRGILSGLEFTIREFDIDIAADPELPTCQGDITLINQVFVNLIDNAIKHRHPERPCRIRIRGRKGDGRSLYHIEDNGVGIAPEHTKKVFEIFHQLNPAVGGDGLGLTIVRRILDRQNGTIEIQSEPNSGTTVTVTLPGE